jgi:hypothetical protein
MECALAYGPIAALDDRPRPAKETPDLRRRWRRCCAFTAKSKSSRRPRASKKKPSDAVAIISYDEKPRIQAVATTAPDLPPKPGLRATFARDHQYKRLGTSTRHIRRTPGFHLYRGSNRYRALEPRRGAA